MQRLIPPRAAVVVHRVSHFARDVLHQRAVQMNVQELRAVADCQYRLAACKRVIEQPVIGMLSPLVRILISRVPCTAKTPRLDVRVTSGESEPIDPPRPRL